MRGRHLHHRLRHTFNYASRHIHCAHRIVAMIVGVGFNLFLFLRTVHYQKGQNDQAARAATISAGGERGSGLDRSGLLKLAWIVGSVSGVIYLIAIVGEIMISHGSTRQLAALLPKLVIGIVIFTICIRKLFNSTIGSSRL
jgi:TRAP-type C4-dicarboxylate transport system permease small subunit